VYSVLQGGYLIRSQNSSQNSRRCATLNKVYTTYEKRKNLLGGLK